MSQTKISLDITGPTTAYVRLPGHPGQLRHARSLPLTKAIGDYRGPLVVLDFDEANLLVGIEIVGEDTDEEDAPEDRNT